MTASATSDITDVLRGPQLRISMNGCEHWMGHVFPERIWCSLEYECVYLHAFETGFGLRAGLKRWISYHDTRRPHPTLGGRTLDEA